MYKFRTIEGNKNLVTEQKPKKERLSFGNFL